MKYAVFLLIFISSRSTGVVQAQAPTVQWQHTIGGDANEDLRSIIQTSNGNFVCAGYSNSGMSGDKLEANKGTAITSDYWVMKLNSSGSIIWQNTIGGSINDDLHCVRATADGGYILGGWSSSNISADKTEPTHGVFDIWIVKLNAAGAIEWQNTIGGDNEDKLRVMEPTADGGYICGGYSQSGISDDKSEGCQGELDYWVFKLNSVGEIEWQNTIGGDEEDVLRAVSPTIDGGYIVGGYSRSGLSGDKTEASKGDYDYWIVKLSAGGSIEWQKTIGGAAEDKCRALQQTADGGYICGGASFSGISGDKTEASQGQHDVWVVKLNAAGSIEWQNSMGGNNDDILYAIDQMNDEGYVFGGYSRSGISADKSEANRGNYDYWIVKLNSAGTIVWDKTVGGNGDDQLEDIRVTADGGFICAGYSNSGMSGDKSEDSKGGYDYWVVKLSCNSSSWFADNDGDGFGNPEQVTSSCLQPVGYVINSGDCDDANAAINPLQPEIADGIDDNCNGIIDEGLCSIPTQLVTDEITATSARFNWVGNGESDKYKIRYNGATLPATTVTVSDPLATSFILNGLHPSLTYNWRIQSVCGNIHTGYSKKQKFTTAAMRIPAEMVLTDPVVFPNPFTSGVTISFRLIKVSFLQINLLDVYGRILANIEAVNLDAGNHLMDYSIPGEITGNIFFIQLISGEGEVSLLKLIRQ